MMRVLEFSSDPAQLASVRRAAHEFLNECGFDECVEAVMVLALDEACTNIIRHAYHHECKPVRMEMERLKDRVRFILRDFGQSCDPALIKSRDLEDVRPGGVGVHIIKQAFDEVIYQPMDKGTRLTLERKFSSNGAESSNDGHPVANR